MKDVAHAKTLDRYCLPATKTLVCVAMLFAAAGALGADEPDFDAVHRKAIAANPPGVTLALTIDPTAKPLRVGELLPMKLTFEFRDPKPFEFNDREYKPDRARLIDLFYVTPAVGLRSLESRYGNQDEGFRGSPSGLDLRKSTPTVPADPSESLQFDRPGKYCVYCTSRRVWKAGTGPPVQKPLDVTSNILEIEILPIPVEVLAEKLRQADKDFGAGVPKDRRLGAVAWLRRLDSEEAARRLAGIYLSNPHGDNAFDGAVESALERSRHRQVIIEELERRLHQPDFGPTSRFIEILALLNSGSPAPAGTALQVLDTAQQARYAKIESDDRYRRQRILVAAYSELLWRELPRKNPTARAITAFSLFALRSDRQLSPDGTFDWTLVELRRIIQPNFLLLPAGDQHLLLYRFWRRLGGFVLAPALTEIIQRAPDKPAKPEDADETPTPLDTVFERLQLADPQAARRLIIAEIHRKHPRVTTQTLLLLPDQPIAELDGLLIARLEKGPEADYQAFGQTAALINRYGSAALLERVQRIVREFAAGGFAGGYPALLCYWLKYAPKSGTAMLEKVLDQPDNGFYNLELLHDMGSIRLAPELLPISLRRLNDPDQQMAESAAWVLGAFGTSIARHALKDRLRRWHDELVAADPNAKEKIGKEGSSGPHGIFDSCILQNLKQSPLTVVTPQELRELRPLCMTAQALQEIDFALSAWTDPIKISFLQGEEGEFEHPGWPSGGGNGTFCTWCVADQYFADTKAELKTLLARFPRGSTFALPTHVSTDAVEFRKFFDELSTFVENRGMKLVKAER